MSGRIADIAVDPTDKNTWYVATASSNVWKTVNRGTTWDPIFDQYGAYSTGCLAIDPVHPATIWLGTGENQSQRSVGWGDGVYKSTDGGKSWQNMGLAASEHIGKIAVHPVHPETVFVAAQGPLWKEGGDRGLYRTQDGGKSWKKVLEVSVNTGISDVVIDPVHPEIMYAASYQRRRHVGILVAGGPEARIYKSTDGGENWRILENGLPGGEVGRIGIAISPQDHRVVYALVVASEGRGGFFRSADEGESWQKMSGHSIVDPQYYGEIYPDPHRFDCIYVIDMTTHYSEDGGKTFQQIDNEFKHVDDHVVVFDPDDPDYLMIGCDGGIYETYDRMETWLYHDNLPITQFYRVGIDQASPFYFVYGGTQDNSTLRGPSQNTSRHGITNRDWKLILGGDGFQARVDPEDPNTIYAQYQYAGIVRYDLRTGERTDIQPQPRPGDDPLRWHWDSPLIISPHHPKRLYFAAQNLFRSDDRGDSWVPVSGDLSRNEDRNQRKVMGRVWSPEAVWKNVFTSPFGTIVSLSESPLREGLIAVGTDDGLIQVTDDGGERWKRVGRFPGVPEKAYVADLVFSQHDRNTLYAVFNNHKEGDFKPYILKSTDLGDSWVMICRGISLPHACWTILEDHVDPKLLFAGTEFGVYCTIDGGASWYPMEGSLPTICVRDMEIHKGENDLVLATFGRGMWILDDYAFLRELGDLAGAEKNFIFPVADAQMFLQRGDLGYRKKGVFGHNLYSGDNPPYGIPVNMYIKEAYPSLKKERKEMEKERAAEYSYPTYESLKAEDSENPPDLILFMRDANGKEVQSVRVPNSKGYHQVVVPFRQVVSASGTDEVRNGPLLPEGNYEVQLGVYREGVIQMVSGAQSFHLGILEISPEGRDPGYNAFYAQARALMILAADLSEKVKKAVERLDRIEKKYLSTDMQASGLQEISSLRKELVLMSDTLEGDRTLIERYAYASPGVIQRLRRISGDQFSTQQVTETHRESLEYARKTLSGQLEKWAEIEKRMMALLE